MTVMPDKTGFDGKASTTGRSMFRPFWSSRIAVWPRVMAGAITSATDGGTSTTFLVVTTTKSKGSRLSLATLGILLRTTGKVSQDQTFQTECRAEDGTYCWWASSL